MGPQRSFLRRIVAKRRRQPVLHLRHFHAFARRVGCHLIGADGAAGELVRIFVSEVKSAHRRGRIHGETFGERDAGGLLALDQWQLGIPKSPDPLEIHRHPYRRKKTLKTSSDQRFRFSTCPTLEPAQHLNGGS